MLIDRQVKKGDIYYADLDPVIGSEQGGQRPVLIIQNDIGNSHSPTVIIAPLTSKWFKARLPTHVNLEAFQCGLKSDSTVLLEQIRTVDKTRLLDYVGSVPKDSMDSVDQAIMISFDVGGILTEGGMKDMV